MENLTELLDDIIGIVLRIPGITNTILTAMPDNFTSDERRATKHDLAYDYLWSLLIPLYEKYTGEGRKVNA